MKQNKSRKGKPKQKTTTTTTITTGSPTVVKPKPVRAITKKVTITGAPRANSGSARWVLHHQETLTPIHVAGSADVTLQFPINPGRAKAFPWLSSIAAAFESYRFQSLRYHYIPVITPYGTSGRITMGIDYDCTDVNTNLRFTELTTWKGSVTTYICSELNLTFNSGDVRRTSAREYFFTANDSAAPKATAELGTLYIMTSGVTSSTPNIEPLIGYVIVEYTVELSVPQYIPRIEAPGLLKGRLNHGADPTQTLIKPLGTDVSLMETLTRQFEGKISKSDLTLVLEAVTGWFSSDFKFDGPLFLSLHPQCRRWTTTAGPYSFTRLPTVAYAANSGRPMILLRSGVCSSWRLLLRCQATCLARGIGGQPYFNYWTSEGLTIHNVSYNNDECDNTNNACLYGVGNAVGQVLNAETPAFIGWVTQIVFDCAPGVDSLYGQWIQFDVNDTYCEITVDNNFYFTYELQPEYTDD